MSDKKEFNFSLDPIPTSTKEGLFNPSANAIGKGAGGVASFISIPFRNLGIWSEDYIKRFEEKILTKNKEIPEENRDFSKFQQTAKAIDDAKYSLGEENLQELFINLISNTLDNRINHNVHPSFSTILKEFDPEDARIFEKIYRSRTLPIVGIFIHEKDTTNGLDIVKNVVLFNDMQMEIPFQLNSLERLGLIEIIPERYLLSSDFQKRYNEFEASDYYGHYKSSLPLKADNREFTEIYLKKGHLKLTDLGKSFGDVIITN